MSLALAALLLAAAPGEVRQLRVLPGGGLEWAATPGAALYNLYRGTDPRARDQVCHLPGLTATSATSAASPAPGALFYYLVSAVGGGAEGPLGLDRGTPVPNLAPCVNDIDADGIPDARDNCPLVPNPDQADQNEDAIGDRCDPKTYDFEADGVGGRPAEMTQVGGVNATFAVKDLGGDRAAAYNAPGIGVYDVFDRLPAAFPRQDTTVWIDFEIASEVCSLELWGDGAFSWNAGTGLIFQVENGGTMRLFERWGNSVPVFPGPAAPASGRVRLRLVHESLGGATLHADSFDGTAWQLDAARWTLADDRLYLGLSTALGDYLGAARGVRRVTIEHLAPPAALTLARHPAWSTDWKLFQRDAAGQATIPVRFLYRLAEPGQVRARVVDSATRFVVPGHDFDEHVVALAPGDGAAGAIDLDRVPAGGNYDVELELLASSDPGTPIASGFLANLAVGDVWIAGGQSNMSGYSGGLAGAELPIDQVHLFHNDYTWKRAQEPMDDGTDQKDRVGAESPGHSLMLRFAKELYRATGVPQAVIPGPLGGTNLYAQWQRDPADHFNRGTLYGSLLHRVRLQGYASPPRGFLWFQGESDALTPRSTAQYRQDLERLAAQVREDTGSPRLYFLNAQLGTFSGAPLDDWLAVQEAERQAALADPDMGLIPCVDVTRSDAIHYDVPGYKLIGARFAELAREEVFGEAIDAQAELSAVARGGAGDRVLLDYDAAVSGGAPSLYEVSDGGGPVPIAAASAAGTRVTIDLTRALAGPATVSYGFSVDPAASWVKGPRGNAVACFQSVPVP